MALASDLISTFLRTYPDCDSARALGILNEVDEEILIHIPLRKASIDIALVANQSEYLLDETILKVWSARLVYSPTTQQSALTETTVDSLDVHDPNWRAYAPDVPTQFYTSHTLDQGTVGLVAAPIFSTVVAAGVVSQSATIPKLTLDVTQRRVLTPDSVMPLTPQIRWLYIDGMRMVYAREKVPQELPMRLELYQQALTEQVQATMQRTARVQPEIPLVNQRSGWRGRSVEVSGGK